MIRIVYRAAAVAFMFSAHSADAASYQWSFDATHGSSFGEVSGTISGLQIGSNDGSGLTVEVLSSPSGNGLGGGWTFYDAQLGGDAFTLESDGSISFADALFTRGSNPADQLYFGGFDEDGYFPELRTFDLDPNTEQGRFDTAHYAYTETVFMALDTPPAPPSTVPLPAGLTLLLSGFASIVGLKLWKRRAT